MEPSLPDGWVLGNIRAFAKMRTGHTPSRSVERYWTDCDIPWFTLADVWQLREGRKYLGTTSEMISAEGLANSAAELLPAGTVVLSRTASVGFTGIMGRPMATSQDYWNWIPGPLLDSGYLWYQFQSMVPYFSSLVQGSTHKTIYQSDAASMSIRVPPLGEQLRITEFLDRETAETDAFIADQEQFVRLLTERRQAAITALIEGSSTGANEHRLSAPLSRVMARITDGAHVPPEVDNGTEPFVSTRDIGALGTIDLEGCLRTSHRSYEYMVRTGCQPSDGDLLFSKDGTVGRTAIVRTNSPFVVASSLVIMTPGSLVDVSYVNYALQSQAAVQSISLHVKGAGLPRISIANVGRLRIPLPELSKQIDIARTLDHECAIIDAAIADARDAISFSKERRAALISAAVSGQIDVLERKGVLV